jgi:hypothetical protein
MSVRVVGISGTPMDLPDAVASGLLASGVVTRIDEQQPEASEPEKPKRGRPRKTDASGWWWRWNPWQPLKTWTH